MSIEQRRFIRFSLDLPAYRYLENGDFYGTTVQQISIGGCLAEWDEETFVGDTFRLELELPNKNRLPLMCKALYKFEGRGIGAKFMDITRFEQELVGQVILHSLETDGLPLMVDPFSEPPDVHSKASTAGGERQEEDGIIKEILSSN